MKLLLSAFLLLMPFIGFAQDSTQTAIAKLDLNPNIQWQNFADAITQLEQDSTGARALIFAYSDDCGWCKRMVDSSYTLLDLEEYAKANYITTKLNVDDTNPYVFKGAQVTDAEVAIALKTEWAVPTHLILELNEERKIKVVGRIDGYVTGADFIKMLKFYHSNAFLNQSFDDFKAGGCQPESCK